MATVLDGDRGLAPGSTSGPGASELRGS